MIYDIVYKIINNRQCNLSILNQCQHSGTIRNSSKKMARAIYWIYVDLRAKNFPYFFCLQILLTQMQFLVLFF